MFRSMRLAVVLQGFPDNKMTEKQAEVVEAALVESINPSDQEEPIQFSATQYENGGLVFTCVNKETKSWLQKKVNKLVPWPGARLAVGQAETTLTGTKYVLWVMKEMKKSSQQILDLLQKQNKDISTTEWKVLRRVPESDRKARLAVWVDDKSSDHLKKHNYKLFLGFGRTKFVPMSEWMEQQGGAAKRSDLQLQNLPRPSVNYTPHKPVGPKFTTHNFLRPLIPSLGFRAVTQTLKSGPSDTNSRPRVSRFESRVRPQRNEFEFAGVKPPHLREAQFTASGRLSPQEHTTLQNRKSRFPVSERPRERGFAVPEQSPLREASYITSDHAQRREPRFATDRSQENSYFASERRQPCETGYGIADPPQLLLMRLIVPDELLPQETKYAALDEAPSHDSTYTIPDRGQSDNPRFRGSYQPPSHDSRFRNLNESPFRESRFRGSDQMQSREDRYVERDPLNSGERRSRMSDSQQYREFDNTFSRVPRVQEDRISGSDFPPQRSRSSYANSGNSYYSRHSGSDRINW
ncbi:uncharacterized protein LOC126213438 [Schistocerca nitens]|uniref:uncharacterized protein LOC126213438 n=1 Tax=Schistocerca nitens TaxID=7011 RepID=UPI002117EA6B|nr:uncharacterized protein LOC126213438 [Schistocerca nitens]